jgi:hypothetical protein
MVRVYTWGGSVSLGDDIENVNTAVTKLDFLPLSCSAMNPTMVFGPLLKDGTSCGTHSNYGSLIANFDKKQHLFALSVSNNDSEHRLYRSNKSIFTTWWGQPKVDRRDRTQLTWYMQDGSRVTILIMADISMLMVMSKAVTED